VISGETRLVGLLGDPVSGSFSPLMHNAAFAALGLDWAYVPLPVTRECLEEAVRGLASLGFVGANVTAPHKLAVNRFVATDRSSVNTLVVRGEQVEGYSTDAAVLEGLHPDRLVILGDGGAATAFAEAFPLAVRFSRRANWPPDVADADVVVNATSERDEALVELHSGQTLIDLPYPATATSRAAERAGARVIDGLDVLVAQGSAAFALWTGFPAPVEVMRAAVRGPGSST
jgi:shikimate dehydrogenase